MIDLVSRDEIEQHKDLIRLLVDEGDPCYIALAKDEFYGNAFRYYLFFAEGSALQSTTLSSLTELEAYYNEYYWLLLFTKLYQFRRGYDCGLEQQAFKLLEAAPENVDWIYVEEIVKRVESEILNCCQE